MLDTFPYPEVVVYRAQLLPNRSKEGSPHIYAFSNERYLKYVLYWRIKALHYDSAYQKEKKVDRVEEEEWNEDEGSVIVCYREQLLENRDWIAG